MKKLLFVLPLFLIVVACSKHKTEDNVELIVKSNNPDSLEFWTVDTIFTTDPFLVRLMEPLYQYVRNGDFPSDDTMKDIEWMNGFRKQLANYYINQRKKDKTNDESRNSEGKTDFDVSELTEYDMADSVISDARTLWELGDHDSTMGMIISNDTERTRLIFEQFNELSRLYDNVKKDEQKEMLIREFKCWLALEDIMQRIFANFTEMHFYGGSIRGPIISGGFLQIWKAHIELYRKEYSFLFKDDIYESYKDNMGTLVNPARNLLIECCKEELKDYDCSIKNEQEDYHNIFNETEYLLEILPKIIDEWIETRKPWEEEMTTDWLRYAYQRNTSEVLIKYASLVCSVQ